MTGQPGGGALLIIDVQNDFCAGGSLEVPEGDRIVPVINRLVAGFPVVVATQDWHPSDHASFASNNPGKKPFEVIDRGGISQTLWPDHCVPGTPGAELHPELDLRQVDLILRKGTRRELDSYSAFFENDRRTPTGLGAYLRERGVERVYLTGLAADVCVYYSATDALRLGFAVTLVQDATRGLDAPPGSLGARLAEMRDAGVAVVQSADLGDAMAGSRGGAA